MPLYKEWSPNAHSLAAIWHIEEEEAFFQVPTGVQTPIKHPKKRIEHLAGRYLLQHLKEDFPLHHIAPDEHDKPRLPDDQYFFSISHSHPYVAAVISDEEECGIDIQCWHPRIEQIAHMFLSKDELLLCNSPSFGGGRGEPITLAWSAKEALYKWYGRRGADFIRDLPIQLLLENSTGYCPPLVPHTYHVKMKCFGIAIEPYCTLYGDFALAYLIRHRPNF